MPVEIAGKSKGQREYSSRAKEDMKSTAQELAGRLFI